MQDVINPASLPSYYTDLFVIVVPNLYKLGRK